MTFAFASKNATTAPGPLNLPLLGNFVEFSLDRLKFMEKCQRKYGDTVLLHIGKIPVYLITQSQDLEYVLLTNNRNYTKVKNVNHGRKSFFNLGLLSNDGESWLRNRRLIQPAFHKQRIAHYSQVIVEYAERAAASWQAGEERNIHEDMLQLSLDTILMNLFSSAVGSAGRDLLQPLNIVLTELMNSAALPFTIPGWLPTPSNLRYNAAVAKFDEIVYGIIRNRQQQGVAGFDDLLTALLEARDEKGEGMHEQQVRDEVVTLFVAGFETSALVMSYTWYLLAQNPAKYARLRQELQQELDGRSPRLEDLARLPYLEQIINEAMRLYPPAWGILRQAVEDDYIGGYKIEAGAVIAMLPYLIHRDARFYDAPAEFRPERWEKNGPAEKLPRYAFFPFGGGQRICIGVHLALMQTQLILATLAQRWEFDLVEDQIFKLVPATTLRPKYGIRMRLH